MKTIIKVLLSLSIVLLTYLCIMSVMTPIRFEKTKDTREKAIIQRLIDIRKVELEYKDQKGSFTDNISVLVNFAKTAKKKIIMKEGALSDKQLEAGLTEASAVKIVNRGNAKEIAENGLQNFRRDTAYVELLEELFPTEYTLATIDQLGIIPFSQNEKFTLKTNNDYMTGTGITVPLFEASAPFVAYLYDLDHQELLNAVDLQNKLTKYPGLKVGSIEEPNNNTGNWE